MHDFLLSSPILIPYRFPMRFHIPGTSGVLRTPLQPKFHPHTFTLYWEYDGSECGPALWASVWGVGEHHQDSVSVASGKPALGGSEILL